MKDLFQLNMLKLYYKYKYTVMLFREYILLF